jgi:hypothetical protein
VSAVVDTLKKAFALALAPATTPAEQQAAWLGALRICRGQGWKTLDEVLGAIGLPVQPERSFFASKKSDDVPYGWEFVMPFGKHQGDTLGVIARTDRNYIEWLHGQELRNGHLRKAVASVYEWCEEHPEED